MLKKDINHLGHDFDPDQGTINSDMRHSENFENSDELSIGGGSVEVEEISGCAEDYPKQERSCMHRRPWMQERPSSVRRGSGITVVASR